MYNYGVRICALRQSHKMSQETLAEKVNVSRQTVARWESGAVTPSVEKIEKICHVFNITLSDFFDEKFKVFHF